MQIKLSRFNIKQKRQKDLFKDHTGYPFNRERWLRSLFESSWSFRHNKALLHYVPVIEDTQLPRHLIVGRIAKSLMIDELTPPEDGLTPAEHTSWRAALLIVDPTHHSDGQKAALEFNSSIGAPNALLNSMAKAISMKSSEPATIDVYPILETGSLAEFFGMHKESIRSITYNAAVPNMFGGVDEFSKELKALRDTANVARVKVKIESDEYIDLSGSMVGEVAEHVEAGGGDIVASTTDRIHYRSKDHQQSIDVELNKNDKENGKYWEKVRAAIQKVF